MPSEPLWPLRATVAALNLNAVNDTGEPYAVRDAEALEAALARPRLAWDYGTEDLVDLAVSLLFAIAVRHPFIQGNKRTGFLSALHFLAENGWYSTAPDDAVADRVIAVLEHRLSEAEFADWLRPFVHPA